MFLREIIVKSAHKSENRLRRRENELDTSLDTMQIANI